MQYQHPHPYRLGRLAVPHGARLCCRIILLDSSVNGRFLFLVHRSRQAGIHPSRTFGAGTKRQISPARAAWSLGRSDASFADSRPRPFARSRGQPPRAAGWRSSGARKRDRWLDHLQLRHGRPRSRQPKPLEPFPFGLRRGLRRCTQHRCADPRSRVRVSPCNLLHGPARPSASATGVLHMGTCEV